MASRATCTQARGRIHASADPHTGGQVLDQKVLQAWLDENAGALGVVGVAAGVLHDGEEIYAYHGVTNVESPLPVDENTVFQYGSTHKTFTATAIMRLVDQGLLSLDDKVRKHIPDLKTT